MALRALFKSLHGSNCSVIRAIIQLFQCNFSPPRYDTRGKSFEEARHWSDDQALQGRAFFRGDHEPGRLVLDNVKGEDQVGGSNRVLGCPRASVASLLK